MLLEIDFGLITGYFDPGKILARLDDELSYY